jgi:hypothetical protein
MVRIEGKCKMLFSLASCPLGEILLPQMFSLEEDTKACPESYSCIEAAKCEIYSSARQELAEMTGKVNKKLTNHTKSLICNLNRKKICCPDEKNK